MTPHLDPLMFALIANQVFIGASLALMLVGSKRRALPIAAVGCANESAIYALMRAPGYALVFAGLAACAAWLWWRSGGDDTGKRLRKLLRRFRPVRRTAPAPA